MPGIGLGIGIGVGGRRGPTIDWNFAQTLALPSALTLTRASSGTYIDSAGALQTASINVARFTYAPGTLTSLGLLIEGAATNILLNSGTLSTQSVSVSATAYTLHFTGTGTITLLGASTSGPLVGTGIGEANRVSLTFTPSAGTLTLTVTGTVTNAQLETGSFKTSYISTAGSAATRAADVCTCTGAAFSACYNQNEWTAFVKYRMGRIIGASEFPRLFTFQDSSFNSFTRLYMARNTDANHSAFAALTVSGTSYAGLGAAGSGSNTTSAKAGISFSSALLRVGQNGVTADDATVAVPTVDRLYLGASSLGTNLNGTIARFTYYRRAMPSRLAAFTT